MAQRYAKPRISKSNKRFGQEARYISELTPSPAFWDDLLLNIRTPNYIYKKDEAIYNNYYTVYATIMHAQAKALDLKVTQLTREMIGQQNLPCNTVKDSVEGSFNGHYWKKCRSFPWDPAQNKHTTQIGKRYLVYIRSRCLTLHRGGSICSADVALICRKLCSLEKEYECELV